MDRMLIPSSRRRAQRFVMHLAPLRRRFPHPFPVNAIGYLPSKRESVDQRFRTMNFSFILSGQGTYGGDGSQWAVLAPCVITQWPGRPVRYGPEREWEELYVMYEADHLPALKSAGLADPSKPVWYLRDVSPVREALAGIVSVSGDPSAHGCADRLDRVCERLILDSLLTESSPAPDPRDQAVQSIRSRLEREYSRQHDLDALAQEHGFSPATFRRHWARIVGTPPRRYVLELRLQHACRMLVETDLQIGEVAEAVGVADPLYFSRLFRKSVGQTASEYRRTHRLPGS